ncbi:flippase activity-associated protein Agl23 [Methanomicrobium mobile]|uniref:flippase activity-associated protein Agl23 n=1 Tax=Methanomicrobium mobile TaxID=2205 RepID=UPI0005B28EFA|nr:flippase activity-associated protein Agl23 [Methanomicrobium mobile]
MRAANFSSQFKQFGSFFTVERTLLILFAVALLLRFLFLDLKLMHHDETIHAWFSVNLLNNGIFSYHYDPTYHGPFLYYVTAGMFGLFGAGDVVGRIIPSLLGSLTVLLVYPIYRLGYLDRWQTVVAAIFLTISTSFVYFSRFLRNDIFLIFFTMILLIGILYYLERKESKYIFMASAAAGLAMSCKENMPIVLGIFGLYLFWLVYSGKVSLPKSWIRDFVLGAVIMCGIMAVFYSSFGANTVMLIEGPFNAIEHWASMHDSQRLGGPFYFYIILLLLYELPILVLGVLGLFGFFLHKENKETGDPRQSGCEGVNAVNGDGAVGEVGAIDAVNAEDLFEDTAPRAPAQATDANNANNAASNLPSFFERILNILREGNIGVTVPIIDKKREFTRFCIFWMLFSLIVYAYLGEKVPWLLLHQLLPMIFVAVYDLSKIKAVIVGIGIVFFAAMVLHTSFTTGDIADPIVQVQNSEELREVFPYMDNTTKIAVSNYVRWPFVWYYQGDYPKRISYYSDPGYNKDIGPENYDLIIVHDGEKVDSIEGFEKHTYKKCYWIDVNTLIQSYGKPIDIFNANDRALLVEDLKRVIHYYFTRDAGLGSINIDVFVKKDRA